MKILILALVISGASFVHADTVSTASKLIYHDPPAAPAAKVEKPAFLPAEDDDVLAAGQYTVKVQKENSAWGPVANYRAVVYLDGKMVGNLLGGEHEDAMSEAVNLSAMLQSVGSGTISFERRAMKSDEDKAVYAVIEKNGKKQILAKFDGGKFVAEQTAKLNQLTDLLKNVTPSARPLTADTTDTQATPGRK